MKEEKKRFVGISGLNIVQLHPIHAHIVVHSEIRIHLWKIEIWRSFLKIPSIWGGNSAV